MSKSGDFESATSCIATEEITGPPIDHPPRVSDGNTVLKRKHHHLDRTSEIWQPFNIRAVQPSPDSHSQILIPRLLLPRSRLPLIYLDPTPSNGEASSSSRLFAARIELLEVDGDGFRKSQPTVLIAQSKSCSRLYAIEKVYSGIYALCGLGAWVAEDTLESLRGAGVVCDAPLQVKCRDELEPSTREWWHSAIAPAHMASDFPISNLDAIKRARQFKLSLKRPSKESGASTPASGKNPAVDPEDKSFLRGDEIVSNVLHTPEDTLKTIRRHYQDALYTSRTSLAYFAKGPLSRARASFQHHDSLTSDCSTLTQYLRTLILTVPLMDKKYRETLPRLVKEYPFSTLSDGESASLIETVKKKSRKSRNDRIGKDGLYAGEDASIAQWWFGRDVSGTACDTEDARDRSLKSTLSELRAREAQLQIILLLETLALEANAGAPSPKIAPADFIYYEQNDATTKAKKSKKPQDLHTLLDLFADRLCIWQSMDTDVGKPTVHQPEHTSTSQNKSENTNDDLRQFCIDVIIPFYGTRLPEVSAVLCQKLGGPKDPSPKRAAPKILETMLKVSTKPGAPLLYSQSRKPRRTLERVLTDDKARHKRLKPSLSRSATEPVLRVKREVSDATLSSIPLNRIAVSKRYSQREVDLRDASQATEARHKKKIAIQKELQGAIAAIKKPNPKMAGRDFVETVERRQASSHSRKIENPVRNPFARGLQVMATPSRKKLTGSCNLPFLPQTHYDTVPIEVDDVPPSSVSRMIPSSTMKLPQPHSYSDGHIIGCGQRSFGLVNQTPTRGSAKFIDCPPTLIGEDLVVVSSEPRQSTFILNPLDLNVQETPSRKTEQKLPTWPTLSSNLQATPSKKLPAHPPVFNAPYPFPQPEEPDIYSGLGWNYEINDEGV